MEGTKMKSEVADLTRARVRVDVAEAARDAAYVGSIPTNYHEGIGPFLFEPYALHTAERIRQLAPRRVLETACGTGIVTRQLRAALPNDALLIASDLNEPMIAVAKETLQASANVEWIKADMTQLSFVDGHFDALVCQFGLMFVPDKLAALREARRVLERNGTLLLTTWAPLARNPVVQLAQATMDELMPNDPPRYYERAPFGYGDPDVLASWLREAGFSEVRVEVVQKEAHSPSARAVAVGLIEGYPIADEIRTRSPELLSTAVDEVERAIRSTYGEPVRTHISALVAEASA
jgi:ubiquinone/menaquinone biosynthesis C-methylase UbiE